MSDPKDTSKVRVPRKVRDNDTINSEILSIARKQFAQKSFDKVRLEDIAEKAGVSVTHIMRNFESKEGLFQKSIDQQFKLWDMMSAERPMLGEFLSKYVTAPLQSEEQLLHVLLFINGSLHKDSRSNIQEKFESQFLQPYAQWLGGEASSARSSVITSFLFGVTFFNYICESESFKPEKDLKEIQKIVAPIIQKLIDGNS